MMHRGWLLVVASLLCGCTFKVEPPPSARPAQAQPAAGPRDPINALVAGLSKTSGMWTNGIAPVLELPEKASIEELVAEFFEKISYEEGRINSHTAIESRRVTIAPGQPDDQYTAVLIDTNLGRKILLLQYSKFGGWWCRVYDA